MDENDEVTVNLDTLVPDEEGLFDPKIVEEVEATETPPIFNSEEWHDYVMRQFMESELEKGNPIRDGLVRVAEKLIGPIARREIVGFQSGNDANYYRFNSTVHIRLVFLLTNESHPLYGKYTEIIEDGIAETTHRNTPGPFNLHPSATASSKAEAQALRKALRLRRTVPADEITPEDMVMEDDIFIPDEPISQEQINVIDLLCKRLNVSVLEFVNSGEIKYAFIDQVSSSKGLKMIKFLNQIQSGQQKSPTTKQYDPGWRVKERKDNESTTQG